MAITKKKLSELLYKSLLSFEIVIIMVPYYQTELLCKSLLSFEIVICGFGFTFLFFYFRAVLLVFFKDIALPKFDDALGEVFYSVVHYFSLNLSCCAVACLLFLCFNLIRLFYLF